jgi:hypothetical protein
LANYGKKKKTYNTTNGITLLGTKAEIIIGEKILFLAEKVRTRHFNLLTCRELCINR